MRDGLIRDAIRRYRELPCSAFLPASDEIVAQIERYLGPDVA